MGSLTKAFLSLLAVLWNPAFRWVSFLFSFTFSFSSFLSYLEGCAGESNKMWSTGEGNGKPLQYSCLENPMKSIKRQDHMTQTDELPMSVVKSNTVKINIE